MKMKNLQSIGLCLLIAATLFISSCANEQEGIDIVLSATDLSIQVAENPTPGQVLGTIEASSNVTAPISFAIASQSVAGAVNIDSQSGEVTVGDASAFDFETNPTINATVTVSSEGESTTVTINITVTDVVEDGLSASNFSVTLEAEPSVGQSLGTIQASTTNNEAITFEITAENPLGALNIGQSSGEITVADASLFDINSGTDITATVTVRAGSLSQEVTVTISLEAPSPFNIWDGPDFTFTKADGASPNDAANQDRLTDNVIITRGNSGGQIYNIASETAASQSSSPAGTEWAEGSIDDIANLTFRPFRAAVSRPRDVVGKNLVLHLIEDDIYLTVRFTSWSTQRAGGFSYVRSSDPN